MFTKKEALLEINQTQDEYVSELIRLIEKPDQTVSGLKEIDFTSPTDTGKTIMIAKLINRMADYFFVVTTLSKGQLRIQVANKLAQLIEGNNYLVFGLNEYTKSTRLQREEIDSKIDWCKKVVWIRDEGHIATNRWAEILRRKSHVIVNFSATNKYNNGIQCNFAHTMMLRTVSQSAGTPEDALDKLVEVKKVHRGIKGYNPCALLRVIHSSSLRRVISACEERGLSFINITDQEYDMADICRDDNGYDVIINKFKITEGIDLKRCHVIYMDSKPGNDATVVQVIGRARRNALFWRDDVDILKPSMSELLDETRRCYVFYNIPDTEVEVADNGELAYSLCDTISVESLKPNIKIRAFNGQLPNGLRVIELEGKTGTFSISFDEELGCNVVDNPDFYVEKKCANNNLILDFDDEGITVKRLYLKPNILNFFIREDKRRTWKNDYKKYWFYLWKKYAESKGLTINFDYWGEVLGVDKKEILVSAETFGQFRADPSLQEMFQIIREEQPLVPHDWKMEALNFSKKPKTYLRLEKRNILVKADNWCEDFFDPQFLPYLDKADYADITTAERIGDALEKANNISMLGPNRFRVSQHPLSKYLKDRGFESFGDFKEAVISSKGKTIFLMKVDYWRNALQTVASYSQLDEFDSRIADLEEVNALLSIGLSKKEVKESARGQYIIRSCSGKGLKRLKIYGLDRNGTVNYNAPGSKYILRRCFDKKYLPYTKTVNDREIATIGPDTMRFAGGAYIEDRAVTSKIAKFSKFRSFISSRYAKEIADSSSRLFSGENDFGFDKKCNSCLGFCVEYYAKIKLFGDEAYKGFIEEAMVEAKTKEITDLVRVRASMAAYRDEMVRCYGRRLAGLIPSISVEFLIKENYAPFVAKVIELGNKTFEYVLANVYGGRRPQQGELHDPNLSVNHIAALCDFVSQDTILDVKCTSSITSQHVLQVLGYHYLSTKRSDLRIKRLIVFEAVTGRSITIDL